MMSGGPVFRYRKFDVVCGSDEGVTFISVVCVDDAGRRDGDAYRHWETRSASPRWLKRTLRKARLVSDALERELKSSGIV